MEELPHVFRRFWPMLSFFTLLLVGVIIATTNLVPFQWQVTNIFIIIPLLCMAIPHILYITVLNRESPQLSSEIPEYVADHAVLS